MVIQLRLPQIRKILSSSMPWKKTPFHLPISMLRTTEEFMKEIQYTEVLSKEPLFKVEKIGESDPVPFKSGGKTPLDGVRALGMGHVIAGAGIGRDLALFGADVLNILIGSWRYSTGRLMSV